MPTYTIEDAPATPKYTVEDDPASKPSPPSGISRFLDGSWRDPLTRIEPHQPVHSASDLGREVVRGVGNIGAGGLGMLLRPVAAVEGIGSAFRHPLDTAKAISDQAMSQPLETAESFIGQAGATAGVGELGGKAMRGVAKVIPKTVRAATGTGPKVVGDLVKQTQAGNEAGDAFSSVRSAIETAREKALKEGNAKYTTLNEKLNAEPANRDAIQAAVADATSKIKGSDTVPPILKDIASRVDKGDFVYSGGMKFGPGTPLYESVKAQGGLPTGGSEPLGYKDLQGYYSELGTQLSKGNLPGDVYTALDTLHEAIGNEMQRIADSKGLGQSLTEARNYWRRMKQAFGRPLTQPDAASQTLHSLAPDLAERDTMANRIRLLGSFDPEIPKQFERLDAARKAAKGAPPVTPGEKKTVGAEDVKGAKAEKLAGRADWIENRGVWAATWPLFHVMSSIMRGEIPNVGSVAMESAGTYGAARGVANILRNPKVVEFLTKATPKDVEQIPPDLRGNFPSIVQAAQKSGIKVAPALKAMVGGAAVAGQSKKRVAAALDIGTSEGNPGTQP